MNAPALSVEELSRQGIRLEPRGDKLHVEAPRGAVTPELRERLAAHKAELMAELAAHHTPSNTAATPQSLDTELLERCKEACKSLALWPAELMAALDESGKAAQLSGEEGPETLRAFAESLAARLRAGTLPEGLQAAYGRLQRELTAHPGQRFASEVLNPDDDPVLLAVAVRGAGFATLRIAKDRYDVGTLLEIVHRLSTEKAA